MTIEKLLDLPTDELGRLTSNRGELEKVLAPYLLVTRPTTKRQAGLPQLKGASAALLAAMNGTDEPPSRKILLGKK